MPKLPGLFLILPTLHQTLPKHLACHGREVARVHTSDRVHNLLVSQLHPHEVFRRLSYLVERYPFRVYRSHRAAGEATFNVLTLHAEDFRERGYGASVED